MATKVLKALQCLGLERQCEWKSWVGEMKRLPLFVHAAGGQDTITTPPMLPCAEMQHRPQTETRQTDRRKTRGGRVHPLRYTQCEKISLTMCRRSCILCVSAVNRPPQHQQQQDPNRARRKAERKQHGKDKQADRADRYHL